MLPLRWVCILMLVRWLIVSSCISIPLLLLLKLSAVILFAVWLVSIATTSVNMCIFLWLLSACCIRSRNKHVLAIKQRPGFTWHRLFSFTSMYHISFCAYIGSKWCGKNLHIGHQYYLCWYIGYIFSYEVNSRKINVVKD